MSAIAERTSTMLTTKTDSIQTITADQLDTVTGGCGHPRAARNAARGWPQPPVTVSSWSVVIVWIESVFVVSMVDVLSAIADMRAALDHRGVQRRRVPAVFD